MRHGLYQEAGRGSEPLLWRVVFQGHGETCPPLAEPIEKLARDQWNQYLEVREFLRETLAVAPSILLATRISFAWITRRFAMSAARQLYWKEKEIRREQARHYGMLVCRAFFKFTMREHMSEEAGRLSPEVVELVEQSLNG